MMDINRAAQMIMDAVSIAKLAHINLLVMSNEASRFHDRATPYMMCHDHHDGDSLT